MNGSLATLAAIVTALVTVALWATVVVGRVPRATRMPLALCSFISAWGLCFLLIKLHFPGWTWFAATLAVITSIVVLIAAAQFSLPRDAGEGSGDEGDGGSPLRRPPEPPTDGGGPADPSWWPEFERDLALYMAERERGKRPVLVGR